MILKNNNKIIRNLGGEIVKQSDALIDLRSTYGLNKTGSAVNYAKLYNNPSQVFRAPSGNEPTENGDGFDFSASETKRLEGATLDYSKSFVVSFWVKLNDITKTNTILSQRSVTSNTFMQIRFNANDRVDMFLRVNNVDLGTFRGAYSNTYTNNWFHVLYQLDVAASQYTGYVNGQYMEQVTDIPPSITINKYPLVIAQLYDYSLNGLNGNIEDFKISRNTKELYNGWGNGTYKYNLSQQVFTPPKRSSE